MNHSRFQYQAPKAMQILWQKQKCTSLQIRYYQQNVGHAHYFWVKFSSNAEQQIVQLYSSLLRASPLLKLISSTDSSNPEPCFQNTVQKAHSICTIVLSKTDASGMSKEPNHSESSITRSRKANSSVRRPVSQCSYNVFFSVV